MRSNFIICRDPIIKSRMLWWAEHIDQMKKQYTYWILMRETSWKPSTRRQRRSMDKIKLDLREIDYEDMNWLWFKSRFLSWCFGYMKELSEQRITIMCSRKNLNHDIYILSAVEICWLGLHQYLFRCKGLCG